MLLGRVPECAAISELLDAALAGRSGVLVLHGEPGVGKTALLEYAIESAAGLRVARVTGVESEMELAFAALQQLCAPMLDKLESLPDPQREALGVAFGLNKGAAPDRFLVGLATLSLLSEVAERQPLVCVIDDAQWLDRASAQALAFVARRLLAEPVALVLATREPGGDFRGLPELLVEGLRDGDARELLSSVVRGRWMSRCVTASSRRREATRWRCSSCHRVCWCRAGRGRDGAAGADRGELPGSAEGAAGRRPAADAGRRS